MRGYLDDVWYGIQRCVLLTTSRRGKKMERQGRATLRYTPNIIFSYDPFDGWVIKKVVIMGKGQVVEERIWPALQKVDHALEAIAVCSLEEGSDLTGRPHSYYRVDPVGRKMPLNTLRKEGFLDKDTLCIIATPSDSHVSSTLQLRRWLGGG